MRDGRGDKAGLEEKTLKDDEMIKAREQELGNWIQGENALQRTCSKCGGQESEIDPPFCKWCGSPMDDSMGKRIRELSEKINEQTKAAGLPFFAGLFNPEIFKAMRKDEQD